MANNTENQHETDDEGEYHFSEDELNYEDADSEPSKLATENTVKASNFPSLNRSKRMMISVIVFIILIFIVYKMVSPNNVNPDTDITAVPTPPPSVNQATENKQQAPKEPPAAVAATSPQPNSASSASAPAAPVPPEVAPTTPSAPSPSNPAAAQTLPISMPAVMPVESVPVASPSPVNSAAPAQTVASTSLPVAVASSASVEQMMRQFEAEYTQKLEQFNEQNKAMQSAMTELATRMGNLESQLHQLVQTLMQQSHSNQPSAATTPEPTAAAEAKIAYNVQAIIPGRAWLRSENGETVTVAEGDTIKDLGRVTKVDPYDGIVQINTGTKIISLSYGGG